MKVYFAGSIRGGRIDANLYERLIKYIQKTDVVLTEHVGNLNLSEEGQTVTEIYNQDTNWLRESDVLIAECTCPSLGVGYELAYAERFQIPCHIFYNKNRTSLSAMLAGNSFYNIHPYEDEAGINEEGQPIDLGFYRKVKPILYNIPRMGFADQKLISRMKIRQTNADISDLKDSVENARKAYEEHKPINLKEKIIEETAPKLLTLIDNLTSADSFENLVEWYLKSLGARTEIPSKNAPDKGEGDADVIGYFDNIKTAIMVQVKKHEGITNEWAIQQIKAYKTNHTYDDYHTQMWVISSCEHYSLKAMNEAEEVGVRLITGIEFASMILNSGLEGLNL